MKRGTIVKSIVIGLAFVGMLAVAMSAQAATITDTYFLGDPGSGTRIQTGTGGLIPWITKGTLPEYSILRSVSVNATIEAADWDSWASDISAYLDPNPEAPGTAALLQVGGYGKIGTVTKMIGWSNGQNGPVATVNDTKTEGDWSALGDIDLNAVQVSIGNDYGPATWSGSISVTYDVPITLTWNGGAGGAAPADGGGTWNATNENWWDTAARAWGDNSVTIFGAGNGTAGDVTVDGTVKPIGITFNAAGDSSTYRLLQGAAGEIDLDGKVVKIKANVDAEIQATITNGGLNKLGTGTLTLSGANTLTGSTTVNAGTLTVNAGSLATLNVPAGTANLNSGASVTTVNVTAGTANINTGAIATTVSVSGTGLLSLSSTVGTLKVVGGTVNVGTDARAATATLSAGTVNAGANALAITNKLTQNNGAVVVTAGATPFKVAGSNVVNNIDSIILQGGTITIDQFVGNFTAGLDVRGWQGVDGQLDGSMFDMPGTPTHSTYVGTIGYATESINMGGDDQEHFGDGKKSGVPDSSVRPDSYSNNYTVEYRGKLYIPSDGSYRFATVSDDGSALWIDQGDLSTANPNFDAAAVKNPDYHGMDQVNSDQVELTVGYHDFIVRMFEGGGGNGLQVLWDPTGGTDMVAIPGDNYFHGSMEPGAVNLPNTDITVTSDSTLVLSGGAATLGNVLIASGVVLDLDFSETATIAGLKVGDDWMPGGIYAGGSYDWLTGPGSLYVVPEPATMSLLVLGGLTLLRRRRK